MKGGCEGKVKWGELVIIVELPNGNSFGYEAKKVS